MNCPKLDLNDGIRLRISSALNLWVHNLWKAKVAQKRVHPPDFYPILPADATMRRMGDNPIHFVDHLDSSITPSH